MVEAQTEQYAFDAFAGKDDILAGRPFKIMPEGKWYRDARVLDITPDRLRQFAANAKAGLPVYNIPINLDHKAGSGKVGTILDVEYIPDGAKGPGLYATKYELTDRGRKAIAEDGYDAVSAEAVWSLAGAKYQNPKTGEYVDNVLTGMALTPTPFFGRDVQLFSAEPPKRHNGYTKLVANMRAKLGELIDQFLKDADGDGVPDAAEVPPVTEHQPPQPVAEAAAEPAAAEALSYDAKQRAEMAKNGEALPDGSFPIANEADLRAAVQSIGRAGNPAAARAHIMRRAKELGLTDLLPAGWPGSSNKEMSMSDEITTTQIAPAVTPEQFAELRAKAEQAEKAQAQVEALSAQVNDLRAQADQFAQAARQERQQRRRAELVARFADSMADKGETLAEKFMALEEAGQTETADYFAARIEHLEKVVREAGLFAQFAHQGEGGQPETFAAAVELVLKDEFAGDRSKYAEAYRRAGEKHPDMAAAYARRAA